MAPDVTNMQHVSPPGGARLGRSHSWKEGNERNIDVETGDRGGSVERDTEADEEANEMGMVKSKKTAFWRLPSKLSMSKLKLVQSLRARSDSVNHGKKAGRKGRIGKSVERNAFSDTEEYEEYEIARKPSTKNPDQPEQAHQQFGMVPCEGNPNYYRMVPISVIQQQNIQFQYLPVGVPLRNSSDNRMEKQVQSNGALRGSECHPLRPSRNVNVAPPHQQHQGQNQVVKQQEAIRQQNKQHQYQNPQQLNISMKQNQQNGNYQNQNLARGSSGVNFMSSPPPYHSPTYTNVSPQRMPTVGILPRMPVATHNQTSPSGRPSLSLKPSSLLTPSSPMAHRHPRPPPRMALRPLAHIRHHRPPPPANLNQRFPSHQIYRQVRPYSHTRNEVGLIRQHQIHIQQEHQKQLLRNNQHINQHLKEQQALQNDDKGHALEKSILQQQEQSFLQENIQNQSMHPQSNVETPSQSPPITESKGWTPNRQRSVPNYGISSLPRVVGQPKMGVYVPLSQLLLKSSTSTMNGVGESTASPGGSCKSQSSSNSANNSNSGGSHSSTSGTGSSAESPVKVFRKPSENGTLIGCYISGGGSSSSRSEENSTLTNITAATTERQAPEGKDSSPPSSLNNWPITQQQQQQLQNFPEKHLELPQHSKQNHNIQAGEQTLQINGASPKPAALDTLMRMVEKWPEPVSTSTPNHKNKDFPPLSFPVHAMPPLRHANSNNSNNNNSDNNNNTNNDNNSVAMPATLKQGGSPGKEKSTQRKVHFLIAPTPPSTPSPPSLTFPPSPPTYSPPSSTPPLSPPLSETDSGGQENMVTISRDGHLFYATSC